jgi:hypothetical protein
MDGKRAWFDGRWRPGFWKRVATLVFVVMAWVLAIGWIQQSIHHYLPKDWSPAQGLVAGP